MLFHYRECDGSSRWLEMSRVIRFWYEKDDGDGLGALHVKFDNGDIDIISDDYGDIAAELADSIGVASSDEQDLSAEKKSGLADTNLLLIRKGLLETLCNECSVGGFIRMERLFDIYRDERYGEICTLLDSEMCDLHRIGLVKREIIDGTTYYKVGPAELCRELVTIKKPSL
jgi:hypothetical protein